MTDNDIAQVRVGYDSFRAEIIRGVCEAEGIPVQLLSNGDNGGVGLSSLTENRLLVRAADVDAVMAIVEDIENDGA